MLRVEEIAQHDHFAQVLRLLDDRANVAQDHGVDVEIKQIVRPKRAIRVEQLHLGPPADQVTVAQGNRGDTFDVGQVGHAHGVVGQLRVQ